MQQNGKTDNKNHMEQEMVWSLQMYWKKLQKCMVFIQHLDC